MNKDDVIGNYECEVRKFDVSHCINVDQSDPLDVMYGIVIKLNNISVTICLTKDLRSTDLKEVRIVTKKREV